MELFCESLGFADCYLYAVTNTDYYVCEWVSDWGRVSWENPSVSWSGNALLPICTKQNAHMCSQCSCAKKNRDSCCRISHSAGTLVILSTWANWIPAQKPHNYPVKYFLWTFYHKNTNICHFFSTLRTYNCKIQSVWMWLCVVKHGCAIFKWVLM